MRDKLFALLSVVVLALAVAVPTTAQFASNDRSIRLRETLLGNAVATPAVGYAALFRDSTKKTLFTKNSDGTVFSATDQMYVRALADSATLLATDAGSLVVYDGAASKTITLPEITASNIGMRFFIVGVDADDVSVACVAADQIIDSTDATVDANDTVISTTVGASATFLAVNATTWIIVPVGTWTIE